MFKLLLYITLIWFFVPKLALSQTDKKKVIIVPYMIENGDTIPFITFEQILYTYELNADEKMRQYQFAKLCRDIKIVMPYARTCSVKIHEINKNMEGLHRRERKHYLKTQEKVLKEEFEDKLRNLNVRQGKLLIKLIDRETGKSSYSLIREYKNGVTALVWQGMAKFIGMDLKDKYNKEENAQIELAIQVLGMN
jgi:hypothetical protein